LYFVTLGNTKRVTKLVMKNQSIFLHDMNGRALNSKNELKRCNKTEMRWNKRLPWRSLPGRLVTHVDFFH